MIPTIVCRSRAICAVRARGLACGSLTLIVGGVCVRACPRLNECSRTGLPAHEPSDHCHVFSRSVFEVGMTCHWAKVLISARRWFPWGVRSGASNGSPNFFLKFRKVGQAVTLTFRTPLESHQNGHIPLRECPHFFQRTQIRARISRFMHPFFTYSLRCECESN